MDLSRAGWTGEDCKVVNHEGGRRMSSTHRASVSSSSSSSSFRRVYIIISSYYIVNSGFSSHDLVSGPTSKRPASDGDLCSCQLLMM